MKRREFLYISACSATTFLTSSLSGNEATLLHDVSYPILKYGFISVDKIIKTMPVYALSTQFEFLYEQGYQTCFIDEILSLTQKTEQKSVALLFSMPDISITNYILPLLKEYNMKATLVILPHYLGKSLFVNGFNYPLLGYEEVMELEKSGHFRIAVIGVESQLSHLKFSSSLLHLNQQKINTSFYQENDIINFIRSDLVSFDNLTIKAHKMENLIELSLFKAYLKGFK